MIKTFESFTNNNQIDHIIEESNKILSNKSHLINKVIRSIPKKILKKSLLYMIDNPIDIDKILYYINKYNIYNKVKKLYDKGYNYDEMIHKLIPSNESVSLIFGIITIITIIVLIGFIIAEFTGHGVGSVAVGIAVVVLFASSIGYLASKSIEDQIRQNKIENINKRIRFEIDDKDAIIVLYLNGKKDSLEVYQNTDEGTYYVIKNNKPYKSMYHSNFE